MNEPLTDPIGTIYRVFYGDLSTALYTEADYTQVRAQFQHEITDVRQYTDARWQYDFGPDEWVISAVNAAGARVMLSSANEHEADTLPDSAVIAQWFAGREAGRGDFDEHYDPETGTASIQAEFGDRTDLGDASAASPVERNQVQELVNRIREWFHRDQQQDRGMDL
jgi:hypothetical protein